VVIQLYAGECTPSVDRAKCYILNIPYLLILLNVIQRLVDNRYINPSLLLADIWSFEYQLNVYSNFIIISYKSHNLFTDTLAIGRYFVNIEWNRSFYSSVRGCLIKDVNSQEGCPVRILCGQGGEALQLWTSALFGAKNFGFFKIYGGSRTDKWGSGSSKCGHLQTRRRSIFCDFVRTSFKDGPSSLWRLRDEITPKYFKITVKQHNYYTLTILHYNWKHKKSR